jgi:hypothetical protein
MIVCTVGVLGQIINPVWLAAGVQPLLGRVRDSHSNVALSLVKTASAGPGSCITAKTLCCVF